MAGFERHRVVFDQLRLGLRTLVLGFTGFEGEFDPSVGVKEAGLRSSMDLAAQGRLRCIDFLERGREGHPGHNTSVQAQVNAQLEQTRKEDIASRKKTFKFLVLKWHPDKNGDNAELATQIFQFLQTQKDWYLKE